MLLSQKSDGTYILRQVYNGKPKHYWISEDDNSSPTFANEDLALTYMVDAYE